MSLLFRLLGRLPLPVLYACGAVLSLVLQYVVRYRRQTVKSNLAHAFPELSETERRRIMRRFYRHLCDLTAEVLVAPRLAPEELARRVVFDNPEVLTRFASQRQSLMLLTCHQGNWEWLLHAVTPLLGCPVDAVYKPLHNRHADELMRHVRSHLGNPIPFQNAAREILRRRREFRAFAMVADQAPFKRDKRHWRTFFGRPASFYLGPQKIAELAQRPVVFLSMYQLRRGYYRVRLEILAEPPHTKGGTEILDRYIDAVEASIRAQPHTWLWSNRKWKHQPPAAEHTESGMQTSV
ncbi:MAG: lysophospholipid acyltransferase family protein [Spongiibacteraceae bacterium]|jgi:KDO2-lipid IV(A) lauroyltransferase|nr:lysophospholipid acyltransferase family protein [Spongiibacteraceae bacterium]